MLRFPIVLLLLACSVAARNFDPRRDVFAFSNDTALGYHVDSSGVLHVKTRETPAHLAHRCFCFTRSVLQFWNFARFEPSGKRLTPAEYRERVRSLFRIPVWSERTARIAFPGYADLWDFSSSHGQMLQDEFGSWVMTYLRVGNWRMACPLVRFMQRKTAEKLFEDVSRGIPRALYLAKFPHMNHAVIAYSAKRLPDGGMRFRVYDSNYAGESARLDYLPGRDLFDFERRFYWPGGELRAFPIYTSALQ